MTVAMSAIERAARDEWLRWAEYRGFHICDGCCEHRYCGRSRRCRRWLCVGCWSLGSDA